MQDQRHWIMVIQVQRDGPRFRHARACATESNVYFVDLREQLTYKTEPAVWREIVVTGKDFEEYVKMFLAEFSNIA